MIKSKNEAWRKEIRIQHHEQIKRTQRERILQLYELNSQLALLNQCSLLNKGEELLDHHCFFDCQSFAVQLNIDLFRLINAVGTEYCKKELLDANFPAILLDLTQTIQNKTEECNEEIKIRHYYSREKVIDSITDLVSLLTEDEKLVSSFGEYAVAMLISGIRLRTPLVGHQKQRKNLILALLNLFIYQGFKGEVYDQLRGSNFEQLFRGYCFQIIGGRVAAGDIEIYLFTLFRVYVQYQRECTEDTCHASIRSVLSQLIEHIFLPENQSKIYSDEVEFIDELLKVLNLFQYSDEISLLVLKSRLINNLLSYGEILNHWTYNMAITIDNFKEEEMEELIAMVDVEEKRREEYAELIAGSLVNLILNTVDSVEGTYMIWRCLEKTGKIDLFWEREGESFKRLQRLLNAHPPIHQL